MASEIYWDPSRDLIDEEMAETVEASPAVQPTVRQTRSAPARSSVQTPRRTSRPGVGRQARRSASPPPSTKRGFKWGKGTEKPESKRSFSWGKEDPKPAIVTSQPGSSKARTSAQSTAAAPGYR